MHTKFLDISLFIPHLPIASFTENISISFGKVSWFKQFVAAAAFEAKFVINFPFGF